MHNLKVVGTLPQLTKDGGKTPPTKGKIYES